MNIYGRVPVIEALRSHTPIQKILLSNTAKGSHISLIIKLAKSENIPVQVVPPKRLNKEVPSLKHQGVIAIAYNYKYHEISAVIENSHISLFLDRIKDPMNLGAILRSAEAMGIKSIILPLKESAHINNTVIKASAGAVSHLRIARIKNVVSTLKEIKKTGIRLVGIETSGKNNFDEVDLSFPIIIVIGSEGTGIRSPVLEMCDYVVKIPMYGRINSLNASVSAAIAMYELTKRYRKEH